MVTAPVDVTHTVVLRGNVRSEVRTAKDLGALAGATQIGPMQLLLQRPPQTQAALDRLTAAQLRPGAPEFHRWLSSAEMTRRFAPAATDVAAVTDWLRAQGFVVGARHGAGMVVDFSGSTGQVRAAFHTDIHALDVGGVRHIANVTDPAIPQALAGVVRGVVSLNDFRPHTNVARRKPNYTAGGGNYLMTPADLAKIYNLTPLFTAGISGQGQTVTVIEDTNLYSAADWTRFRNALGLLKYNEGTLTAAHPSDGAPCGNPGVVSDNEAEATLDAEWASAGAPSAAIVVAACSDTQTTFGGLIALQNLLDGTAPVGVVSISYGECETENGATQNAAYNAAYQQAAAQGIAVFVSSGDELAASCDANQTLARHGVAVSGFASTPYNVAVGGHRLLRHLQRHDLHLLEQQEHDRRRLCAQLHPGNALERLLRQQRDLRLSGLSGQLWLGRLLQQQRRRGLLPDDGGRQRRPQRLRDRRPHDRRRGFGNLRRLRQAVLAAGRRRPGRQRA